MEKIIMSEGVASQFKSHLQAIYDYLDECNDAINDCNVLNALGIDNNNAQLKIEVYKQRNDISKLLDSVSLYEENIIALDNSHATVLENLIEEENNNADIPSSDNTNKTNNSELPSDDTSIEKIDQNVKTDDIDNSSNKSVINNDKTIDSIDQTLESKDDTTATVTSNNRGNNNSNNTNQENTSNESANNNTKKYYEFSTNISDMQKAGDTFANSQYSLTYYTNFLLYKYDIKDKEIAEKIYQALLDYGKMYAQNHAGDNPILKQDEQIIIIGIYNIMKEQEGFDINKYPIFQKYKDDILSI